MVTIIHTKTKAEVREEERRAREAAKQGAGTSTKTPEKTSTRTPEAAPRKPEAAEPKDENTKKKLEEDELQDVKKKRRKSLESGESSNPA
ncbi:neurofilament heavy polypeptide-like isoform X1 [Selaginella moellendorffii]|uniref:neurofilament heavy polypeptide-like isoform X1 n=1 Tax=Selaginella moellendorffii TaxID=88036 RepID=UPI000D1D119A|nr:neurofilament heavy polypeptide-like isoform X1 [Selaginella moellendorffii]|eukprot:XP_024517479.1 neurofilament heavy polypeptide-like isoform X1 [Selaginella moellendorffii]